MRAGNSTLRSVIFSWLALMGLTLLSSVLALTNLGSMNALAGLVIAALQAAHDHKVADYDADHSPVVTRGLPFS